MGESKEFYIPQDLSASSSNQETIIGIGEDIEVGIGDINTELGNQGETHDDSNLQLKRVENILCRMEAQNEKIIKQLIKIYNPE